ncbi:MAG: phosphoenolpyruvate synthase [archaeon]|nr:phosphoenolpyruvate synthase [Euryarchaeota archaeon]MDP6704348.1 phosphoenolpyruvate synthase [archaeon]|tara:strand:+ start:41433 stop:44066 length:2634 start_codon:yes stop_codon:yes gene_type:complete
MNDESSAIVLWFDSISKGDIGKAGGKGANLGEITSFGLPVPPGFVVTAQAYELFLKEANIVVDMKDILKDLDVDDTEALNKAATAIKGMIKNASISDEISGPIKEAYEKMSKKTEKGIILAGTGEEGEFVAVRSSATAEDLPDASFAGQQATFLNIRGKKDLVQAVKDCWASLFEPRAIFYRERKGFEHEKVLMSVIVQKMVDSESAGVMFTSNPVTNDESEISIEAAWGLGEAVVAGQVNPDRYLIDKETLGIKKKDVPRKDFMYIRDISTGKTVKENLTEETGSKQVLKEEDMQELARFGKTIEEHYNWPQDIEWAIEDDKIYILQTRAVTTLGERGGDKVEERRSETVQEAETSVSTPVSEDGPVIVEGFGASPGIGAGKVVLVQDISQLSNVEKGAIMVTEMTTPDMVPAMERAAAIVTNSGGLTCHAAIVSRELGIPCIVGTSNATEVLKNGQQVTVNANDGKVYEGIVKKMIEEEEAVSEEEDDEPVPETRTKIYMNLGVPKRAEELAKLPVDGIGLMREEFIFASSIREHPLAMIERGEEQKFIDLLSDEIAKVARAFSPRPVVLRLSDFKTNEYRALKGGEKYEEKEENPMIGWRGCSRYTTEEYGPAFRLELKAVQKVREDMGLKNIIIMLPFVRTLDDVKKVTALMEEEGLHRGPDLKLWMMAEVPSNVILADKFAELVDGFSIGSNDLTQTIMGADRDSELLQRLGYFDERNEAVMRSIARLIKVGKEKGITVSICGQAPSVYPEFTKFLVEEGITSISVNHDVVKKVRRLVAKVESELRESIPKAESAQEEPISDTAEAEEIVPESEQKPSGEERETEKTEEAPVESFEEESEDENDEKEDSTNHSEAESEYTEPEEHSEGQQTL